MAGWQNTGDTWRYYNGRFVGCREPASPSSSCQNSESKSRCLHIWESLLEDNFHSVATGSLVGNCSFQHSCSAQIGSSTLGSGEWTSSWCVMTLRWPGKVWRTSKDYSRSRSGYPLAWRTSCWLSWSWTGFNVFCCPRCIACTPRESQKSLWSKFTFEASFAFKDFSQESKFSRVGLNLIECCSKVSEWGTFGTD